MRRALVLGVAWLAMTAPVAAAHGGYPVVDGRDGGYAVVVQAAGTTADGRPAIDLTTYLTRQDLGEPDLTADVRLRITSEDGTQTVRPEVAGDGYEAVIPGAANAWRKWRIVATVDGAAGRAVVSADPIDDYDGVPALLWPVLAVVVLGAAGASVAVVRRRLRTAEKLA